MYDIVVKKFTFAILSCDEFLVFINENIFAVATPTNPQNDRVYAPAAMTKERRHAARVSTGLHGDRSVADVVSRTIKIRLYTSLIFCGFHSQSHSWAYMLFSTVVARHTSDLGRVLAFSAELCL